MKLDKGVNIFYAYLNLFNFQSFGLVVSANLLLQMYFILETSQFRHFINRFWYMKPGRTWKLQKKFIMKPELVI